MHSEFAFLCGVYGWSDFVRGKKAFVFTEFGHVHCSGTFPIPVVFNQKLDFVEPYLTAIRDWPIYNPPYDTACEATD